MSGEFAQAVDILTTVSAITAATAAVEIGTATSRAATTDSPVGKRTFLNQANKFQFGWHREKSMEPNAAARAIAAWVEKRYQNVFWHCNRCGKSEYATPFHHSWISNFGVCKGCHDEEDSEQMDDEGACDNCGNCYVCRGTSKYMKEFHARRALRWVGSRFDRYEAYKTHIICNRMAFGDDPPHIRKLQPEHDPYLQDACDAWWD